MFKKNTVLAGVFTAALVPLTVSAQQPTQPADPGASPGSSASTPATAEAAPAQALTGNFGLFSQYVFRGLTQTDRKPAVQGGFDYAHPTGLYVGTWASNVSFLRDGGSYRSGGSLEWDFYGGYKYPIGDFGLDIGTLYYYYPGDATIAAPGAFSNPSANTWEIYGAASWKWVSLKYSYSIQNRTFAVRDSKGTWYLDLTASVPLGDFYKPLEGLTLIGHAGRQKYDGTDPRNVGGRSNDDLYTYNDFKVGLSYALPQNFTVGAFYTDTSGSNRLGYGSVSEGGIFPRNIAKSTGTVFVQKTF